MARITTVFGELPLMTRPPINTLKPVCTCARVERLESLDPLPAPTSWLSAVDELTA
jgi:hypothetical protein